MRTTIAIGTCAILLATAAPARAQAAPEADGPHVMVYVLGSNDPRGAMATGQPEFSSKKRCDEAVARLRAEVAKQPETVGLGDLKIRSAIAFCNPK